VFIKVNERPEKFVPNASINNPTLRVSALVIV